jgi:hypothetical protein
VVRDITLVLQVGRVLTAPPLAVAPNLLRDLNTDYPGPGSKPEAQSGGSWKVMTIGRDAVLADRNSEYSA